MYETTIPGGITEQAFRSQLYVDITDTLSVKSERSGVLSITND